MPIDLVRLKVVRLSSTAPMPLDMWQKSGRPPEWLEHPPVTDAIALNEKIWQVLGRQVDANRAIAQAILERTQRFVCNCYHIRDVVRDSR